MIPTIAIATVVLLYGIYQALGAWAYRNPWSLLVAGIFAAALGSMLKSLPIMLKSFPGLASRTAELEIASLVVDPLLGGLAGGLVASAVIIKLQIEHAKTQIAVEESYQFDSVTVDLAMSAYRKVMDEKETMSPSQFNAESQKAFEIAYRAIEAKIKTEKLRSEVSVPGLGEAKPIRSQRPRTDGS